MPADPGLSDDVLGVFTRACTEGRYEVAEHLLRALEAMEAPSDPGSGQIHHAAVAAAYRVLMDLPETEADPRVRHVLSAATMCAGLTSLPVSRLAHEPYRSHVVFLP